MGRGFYTEHQPIFNLERYLAETKHTNIIVPVDNVNGSEKVLGRIAMMAKYSIRRWKNINDTRDIEYYMLRSMRKMN